MKFVKISAITIVLIVLFICSCQEDNPINQYHFAEEFTACSPDWHPENNIIAFSGERLTDSNKGIWTIDGDGNNPSFIFNLSEIETYGYCSQIRWSNDRYLIFKYSTTGISDGIYYIDPSNPDTATFITEGSEPTIKGNISGTYNIAYINSEEGSSHSAVFLTDINGSPPIKLLSGNYDYEAPDWSPYGNEIIYVKSDYDYKKYYLCTYDIINEDETILYTSSDFLYILCPRWAPGGNLIAFVKFNDEYEYSVKDIYIIPSSGGIPVKITEYPFDPNLEADSIQQISWSPDGKWIVFDYIYPGELWMVEL